MREEDTIAAIATAAGNGAVGIVRLSGPDAVSILAKVWQGAVSPGQFRSRRIYTGRILSPRRGVPIDHVVAFLMRAPSSYTGEDVIEVQGHGGQRVMELLLEALILAGARPAGPGEFTRRAFVNGQMDLSQAEAVADLIGAGSARAVELAERQLEGKLSEYVERLRNELKVMRAQMEAMIDFPEDEDVGALQYEEAEGRIEGIAGQVRRLLESYEEGRLIREGIRVAIVGKPNAGKSSLFNALLRQDRAIVHAAPGTTRDVLEETLDLKGIMVRLMDTAGIRAGRDLIESEGIRRARERLSGADLVLVVLDSSRPLDHEDEMVFEMLGEKGCLFVYNKVDLPPAFPPEAICELRGGASAVISVCATEGEGIDDLKKALVERFFSQTVAGPGAELTLTNLRHRVALEAGESALRKAAKASGDRMSLEFVAADLAVAMNCLGEVTGEVTTEEILDAIFSKFCIGK